MLTAAEGHGLDAMASGLVKRYRDAGQVPPKVMYVDRDCCTQHGQSRVKAMFSDWDELVVRLDIWHFMRRFAAGVTTEAHPLYGVFMARLSTCIFEWDPEDVAALRRAKEGELAARKSGRVSDKAVSARITRRELALHCRRRTRGLEETTRLIGTMIDRFDSADGKDTLGVPLLDHERIQQIWKEQQKHVLCVQDPEDFPLYIKTGTLKKGGVELSCFRCARGSTSLESFHLHLNRFIPGTTLYDTMAVSLNNIYSTVTANQSHTGIMLYCNSLVPVFFPSRDQCQRCPFPGVSPGGLDALERRSDGRGCKRSVSHPVLRQRAEGGRGPAEPDCAGEAVG